MDELPRPGTAVHLAVDDRTWRTELVEAGPDGLLLSLGETAPPELLRLESGLHLTCRYHESQAVCTFTGTLLGSVRHGELDCLRLALDQPVARSQRRQHARVTVRIPLHLRLPLRNEALSQSLGRDFILDCWVQATALNISAGGFRAALVLPRQHVVANHRQATARFELAGLHFHDRPLNFIRRDWSSEEPLHIYMFADLQQGEIEAIESFSVKAQRAGNARENGEER